MYSNLSQVPPRDIDKVAIKMSERRAVWDKSRAADHSSHNFINVRQIKNILAIIAKGTKWGHFFLALGQGKSSTKCMLFSSAPVSTVLTRYTLRCFFFSCWEKKGGSPLCIIHVKAAIYLCSANGKTTLCQSWASVLSVRPENSRSHPGTAPLFTLA